MKVIYLNVNDSKAPEMLDIKDDLGTTQTFATYTSQKSWT